MANLTINRMNSALASSLDVASCCIVVLQENDTHEEPLKMTRMLHAHLITSNVGRAFLHSDAKRSHANQRVSKCKFAGCSCVSK